eukprot:TRINITY_DN829_c0_g1_i10.p1 TRINITY_DN829_c0_g1~~TRINITY_DN829_c0_g1_i10.p1  ORF type:complete len:186 (+),score=59.46 TRINITY_DN829_c0_g1_i10:259-816(+)
MTECQCLSRAQQSNSDSIIIQKSEDDDDIEIIEKQIRNQDDENAVPINFEIQHDYIGQAHNQSEEKKELKETDDKPIVSIKQEELVEERLYTVYITYDTYYFTPRLWLSGFNSLNIPLSQAELFQDINSDYANKTVTFETNPQLGITQASIHPCKHSHMLKYLICLLYTSPSPRDVEESRMPSSA